MKSLALALLVLAGCPAPSTPASKPAPRPGASPTGTRLVVLLVIDQWPQWSFVQKRPALTGGFDRLLREGAWHTGVYSYPATQTAPGHATLGTGEPPSVTGIVANQFWNRDAEKLLESVEDLDGSRTTRWLRVPGLGDAIAAAKTGAKAVAVSLKDRAALLPLGHAGLAIWYDRTAVAFTSNAPRPWLAAHARAHPIPARFAAPWTPLDAARLAQLSGTTDDQPGERALTGTRDPADALYATPLGNDLVLETALAAIDGEQLGADDAPDLLSISLSSHDYVGHAWGHESWEAWDLTLRLDERLAELLAALDAKVGAGRWALIATSDHGAAPLPERRSGGRITYQQIHDAAQRAAVAELGAGDWIASAKFPTVSLTAAGRAQEPRGRTKALTKIVYALRSFPGIARVEKTAELAGHCGTRTGDAAMICLALDRERSGEVIYLPAPGWVVHDNDEVPATAHGSLNDYDREVPLILLPPKRTAHPAANTPAEPIEMTRVATLLAGWLGVTPPPLLPRN
jgi:hypothetical protein